jgi:hypothetical protein
MTDFNERGAAGRNEGPLLSSPARARKTRVCGRIARLIASASIEGDLRHLHVKGGDRCADASPRNARRPSL